ncbi:MAG: glycerol kinase GlpK [Lachnospiraceae bacterium]|nr:glycerol kinase GlpK [Lachnospiraceae bacterium]
MEKYIMALDQGTTSSRCILFNKNGEAVAQKNVEFEQIFPKPGWVEHNPENIWLSQYQAMKLTMDEADITPDQVEAIGITNQRETTIVWDKDTGKPVYNAIVWQCRRTSDIINVLVDEGYSDLIRDKTGLVPDAYFSGSKIKWILDNVEGARENADKGKLLFGTVDTWLMWKLSGGTIHATDYTNASRTMIYNIYDLKWDEELLSMLSVPQSMLPQVLPSSGIFGYTDETLFGAKVPICGVAGDQQAALFGQCCFNKGDIKNTYGTGCFLLMNTGKEPIKSEHGLITTLAAATDGGVNYALEGSVFVAGAAIQWLRDQLRVIENAPQSEYLASQVEDTDGVYVVPAFTGMGAPYWEPDARGIIVGLTRGTSREHMVRATLESLAYQSFDLVKSMEKDLGEELHQINVDGGACANNLLMQFQADILGMKVLRPGVIETTGLGAAYLAGLATGYWKDANELLSNRCVDKVFDDKMSKEMVADKIKGWHKAVKCALAYAKE